MGLGNTALKLGNDLRDIYNVLVSVRSGGVRICGIVCRVLDLRGLDLRSDLSLATHLAIDNVSYIIRELRHRLGILVVSHVSHILDAFGYILELVFDSVQGARKDSVEDCIKRDRNN